MSFILDALKKSEIERQRQAIPGLMDPRVAQNSRGFPLWAIALVGLLAINLVVLVFFLTRAGAPASLGSRAVDAPGAGSAAAPSPAAPAQNPAAATPAHFSPLDAAPVAAAPVYAPEIPMSAPDSPGASTATASMHAAQRRDPLLTDDDRKSDEEVLPSISEVNLQGQQALPDLHLDVHVYATKPAERFVYINMRKYREGATLEEGPTLERIRRDGVILNLHGLRFVLPRQQ
jgi:general secretion pathway protein B